MTSHISVNLDFGPPTMPQVGHPIFSTRPTISEWGWGQNFNILKPGGELTSDVQYLKSEFLSFGAVLTKYTLSFILSPYVRCQDP